MNERIEVMETIVEEIKVGSFVDLTDTKLGRRLKISDERMVREVLAVYYYGAINYNNYSIILADKNGVSLQKYLSEFSQLSLVKDDDVIKSNAVTVDEMPISKWGTPLEAAERLMAAEYSNTDERVIEWLTNRVYGYEGDFLDDRGMLSVRNLCKIHAPVLDGPKISLFLNAKDHKRNRRTTMKVGRAFKHMFQNLKDDKIAKLSDWFVEDTSPRKLVLKVGSTATDFDKAYSDERAKSRNLSNTTRDYKSLAMSCMHDENVSAEVDGDKMHISPAYVYGSGDFTVACVYLEEDTNILAGRVIYSNRKQDDGSIEHIHAPIYASCAGSSKLLTEHLDKIGATFSHDLCEWNGLRLLKVPSFIDSCNYIVPYLDGEIRCDIGGAYLNLCEHGDYTLQSTDGRLIELVSCCGCGGTIEDPYYDSYSTDDGTMCEYCFTSAYGICDNSGEVFYHEDLVDAHSEENGRRSRWTRTIHMDDAAYCELLEEWWEIDDVTQSDCGEVVPTCKISDFPELFNKEEPEELEVLN